MGQFMIPVDIKDKTVVSKDIRHEIMMLEDDEGMMAKDEGKKTGSVDYDRVSNDKSIISIDEDMVIDKGVILVDQNMTSARKDAIFSVDETMESVEEIVASKNWAVEEKDEIMISTDDNNMIPMHAVMILSGEDTISVDQAMRLIEDMQSKYEAMEVEDQIVLQLNDSMGSMDEVIVRKDKAMEIEDQVMILKSDNETTISLENRWNQLAKLIIPKGDQRIV
ncbi:hypothetical protein DINM_002947 [Dirofilaria immitis]|nr:hypothetical protein [Dirofilaria immitis]